MGYKLLAILLSFIFLSCQNERVESPHPVRSSTDQQQEKKAPVAEESKQDTEDENLQTASIQGKNLESKKEVFKSYNDKDIYNIKGTYHLDTIEINRPVQTNTKIISGLGNLIADFIVRIGGDFDVQMDPLPLDVSDVDKDVVKKVIVKRIKIEAIDKTKKTKLDFIRDLKLFLVEPSDLEKRVKLIDTTYKQSASDETCKNHCLDIEVSKLNLIDFIGDTKEIILIPEVEIGKIPKSNFEIKISIDFEVGINMPL